MRVLDLFAGAGGCSRGYADAGFQVVGVDINPQPNYPYTFLQYDAIKYLEQVVELIWAFDEIDLIHASPPCQFFSTLRSLGKQDKDKHVDLVTPIRELLKATGKPYVIENVVGCPLINPVVLCGQYFGLDVRRHRKFETNWPLSQPNCKPFHKPFPIAVYGDHPQIDNSKRINRAKSLAMGQEAMGIDWMNWKELTQAIPPAYCKYIGEEFIKWKQES